jgi:uncharacterized protein
MKLQLSEGGTEPHFTGYGEGYVAVSGQRYECPLLVIPGRAVEHWNVTSFETLTAADFDALLAMQPEIVVFGSGATLRFPRPEIVRPLAEAGVGLEVMDTRAACRTYNILLSEDRKVLAAILMG